jgi:hypothetical protein
MFGGKTKTLNNHPTLLDTVSALVLCLEYQKIIASSRANKINLQRETVRKGGR